jgi:CRP/FNR family transcriptional regulator
MPQTFQLSPDDLRAVSALAELPDEELETLVRHGEVRAYADGEALFEEGTPATALYLVLDGAVRIHRSLTDGSQADLAVLERGTIMGEVALLARSERTASASAQGHVRVLRLERAPVYEDFHEGRLYARTLMFGIAELLAHRLEAMNRRLVGLLDRPRTLDPELLDFKRKILDDWAV